MAMHGIASSMIAGTPLSTETIGPGPTKGRARIELLIDSQTFRKLFASRCFGFLVVLASRFFVHHDAGHGGDVTACNHCAR